MKELISKLRTCAIVIENLPEIPGYNGSLLQIDDTEAETIAKDIFSAAEKMEYMRLKIEFMQAGLNAIANPQILSSHGDPQVLRDYARKVLDHAK